MVEQSIRHSATLERWWIYQRERFPLLAYGALIAAFSLSAMGYSALLRGQGHFPSTRALLVGFSSALLFFLTLRISDECKDHEDDTRFRPYRAVPRGLVTLRELKVVALVSSAAQLALTLWLDPSLVGFLLVSWAYLALMRWEFFVPAWLRARPLTYMWTHLLFMPLVTLYVTACDWWVAGMAAPDGLLWLLLVNFCNGFVLEIGRKIRAPQDEEPGVDTYTALWGRGGAVMAWLGALFITATSAWMAASQIRCTTPLTWVAGSVCMAATVLALRFLQRPVTARAKVIDHLSGVWTMLLHGSLGLMPWIWRT